MQVVHSLINLELQLRHSANHRSITRQEQRAETYGYIPNLFVDRSTPEQP